MRLDKRRIWCESARRDALIIRIQSPFLELRLAAIWRIVTGRKKNKSIYTVAAAAAADAVRYVYYSGPLSRSLSHCRDFTRRNLIETVEECFMQCMFSIRKLSPESDVASISARNPYTTFWLLFQWTTLHQGFSPQEVCIQCVFSRGGVDSGHIVTLTECMHVLRSTRAIMPDHRLLELPFIIYIHILS